MGTIFMNLENSKTSDPHSLVLIFAFKINFNLKSDEYIAFSNLNIQYTWEKHLKNDMKT